jgi:hypothetical protein
LYFSQVIFCAILFGQAGAGCDNSAVGKKLYRVFNDKSRQCIIA